jgi:hypothetical protein
MKIVKVLFVFAMVSMIAVSCKETKKEEISDEAVEMTEDSAGSSEMEVTEESGEMEVTEESEVSVEGAGAAAAASGSESETTMEEVEAIEGESMGMEEVVVPEGVIAEELADTPVVYPGCSGSVEEIRACNKESFIAYLKSEFNRDVAKNAGFKNGNYKIGVVLHVNKAGRVFSLRVTAPKKALETEMERVINSVPQVVPATEAGAPVGVSVMFQVDFRIEKL